ncbi:MAG: DUF3575 domain-containing protein [Sphingobacteriia bacterium]|nr:MAG: DUF3575 domain-containing protein [Sphingobacteriia bacterium]
MKNKIFLCLLLGSVLFSSASGQKLVGGKNIVKWNLGSMLARNYHFSYERHIAKNFSFQLSYRFMPKGSVPYNAQFENLVNSNVLNFSRFEMGNWAITPEARIYLSLGRMKGFYLAPYVRFAQFDLTAPVKFSSGGTIPVQKNADFAGIVKSTSGGLMIGYQFQLLKKLVLDFQILGGHYGKAKGDLNFVASPPLTPLEVQNLNAQLASLELDPYKFTYTVNTNGAQMKVDGPWAGVRAINIGLGIRF